MPPEINQLSLIIKEMNWPTMTNIKAEFEPWAASGGERC